MFFLVFAAVAAFGKAAVLSDDFFAAAAIFAVNLITIFPELYKILILYNSLYRLTTVFIPLSGSTAARFHSPLTAHWTAKPA